MTTPDAHSRPSPSRGFDDSVQRLLVLTDFIGLLNEPDDEAPTSSR
jgi:hypothetical protein